MGGEYSLTSMYQPGYSSFKNYGVSFPSYQGKINASTLSMSTDARTANVVKEVTDSLNMGIKNIELSQVSAQVLEAIPKGHLKEVNRLAKLTGVETTLHAPVMEVSGINPQQGFDETQRQSVERQLMNAIDRANELNPDKSTPVTFHSSAELPGHIWEQTPDGKRLAKMFAVNVESGKMAPIDKDIRYKPTQEGVKEIYESPEEKLKIMNDTEWSNSIFQIETNREHIDRIMQDVHPLFTQKFLAYRMGQLPPESITSEEMAYFNKIASATEFANQAQATATTLFSNAYEKAKKTNNQQAIENLNALSKKYAEALGMQKESERNKKLSNEERINLIYKAHNPINQSAALALLRDGLNEVGAIDSWVPMEEFAMDKSAETFSNLALYSYKKYKDNAPIISIENPPAGGGFSTGEELKMLVDKTRQQFVEKAKKDGMSESQAKKVADNLIGVTWDVGHINMIRKQGFDEKEIIKQTEKIAPYLKHVHLSDNFGLEHTELPMGMGNVPLKEIMEKLGKKGFESSKVVEAMSWWQHFSQGGKHSGPFGPTLSGLGSGFYSTGGPTWNQAGGFSQGYFSGYGMMLPSVNYETFGSGFSTLPAELGGQRGGQGSRMSGRGME